MSNANQPAFPCSFTNETRDGVQTAQYEGISKFEWFAAHAPAQIPDWFEHSMETNPEPEHVPPFHIWRDSHSHGEIFFKYWDIENDDWFDQIYALNQPSEGFYDKLKEEARAHIQKYADYREAREKWKQLNSVERYFQWREYYGLKMSSL